MFWYSSAAGVVRLIPIAIRVRRPASYPVNFGGFVGPTDGSDEIGNGIDVPCARVLSRKGHVLE